jgi:hypothetical protein
MPDLPLPSPNASGLILLEHGKTYAGTLRPRSGQRVMAVGDESKPRPLVRPTGFGVDVDGVDDIHIVGVDFESVRPTKDVSGLKLYHASNVLVRNCGVRNFGGMGVQSQTYSPGRRNANVVFDGCDISGNYPAGSAHVSGIFANNTDGLVLRRCLFDTNGWKPGARSATVYNHGAYIHASCGPITAEGCVFRNNSATGMQARSGGDIRDCVFIDNPVGLTYGYVNGSPCHAGGVSGAVERLVFIGGRHIGGAKRGWCLDLGNIKQAVVRDCILAHFHGTEENHNAINVKECEDVQGTPAVGILSLALENIYAYDRDRPFPLVTDGRPSMVNVGNPPPTEAELRQVIANLTDAAEIVRRCMLATGVVQEAPPPPEPTPQPQPTPGPTLEAAIRAPGSQLVFLIEGGKAKIKLVAPGVDPRWVVVGDTLSRE